MRNRIMKWLSAGLCGLLVSCAIITVNVYFPEKDVKQAYKSLDEMLLKQQDGTKPPVEEQPSGNGERKEEVKPQSRLLDLDFRFSLISEAAAQEPVADELAIELSSMPEVLKAYDDMKGRLPKVNALLDSGAIGLNKQ